MEGRSDKGKVEREIDKLVDLQRASHAERWKTLYRADPPKGISTRLMIQSIAYEMQAKQYGGLRPATVRRLNKIANGKMEVEAEVASKSPLLDPGAKLIREWNGVSHTVDVTDLGFEWRGARYRSLSEIAREITGARWSGPRFFGLTRKSAR